MAVRFLPSAENEPEPVSEREHLAEVIQLRSLLANLEGYASARSSGADAAPECEPKPGAEAETEADVRADGVRLLARRALSSGELREALLARDHRASAVDEAILEFEGALYLDDAGLARACAEKLRRSKRASRAQIRVKLRERKLPGAVIESVIAELDDEAEELLLREAAEDRARRLDGLDRQAAERRLLGYLGRRGWSGEAVYRVVREVLEARR